MKILSAFTEIARRRRSLDVMRLATLSLAGPGTPQILYMSDRSRLVRSVQIYEDWANGITTGSSGDWKVQNHPPFSALVSSGGKVYPSATSATWDFQVINYQVLPMDQWAEGIIGTWNGSAYRSLSVILRAKTPITWDASDPAQFYEFSIVNDGVGNQSAGIFYFDGANWNQLAITDNNVLTFSAGDRIRAHADGRALQMYHNDALIIDIDDASIVNEAGIGSRYGFVGLQAYDSSGTPSNSAWGLFRAGTLKQEYVGCVLDWGVVGDGLGMLDPRGSTPSIDLTVHNLRPIGGKPRFSDLWNHGQNTDSLTTYDFSRARLSIYLVPVGGVLGSALHPGDEVSIGTGTVDDVVSMSEEKLVIKTNQEPLSIPDDSATSIPQCALISGSDDIGVLGPDDRPIFGTATDPGSRNTATDDDKPGKHNKNALSPDPLGPGGPTTKEPSFSTRNPIHGLTQCGVIAGTRYQGPFYFSCIATPFEDPAQRRWFFTRCYNDSDLAIAPPLTLFCSSLSVVLWDQFTCAQGGAYAGAPNQVPENGLGFP